MPFKHAPRNIIGLAAALMICIGFGAAAFAYRGDVGDVIARWRRGPVPRAVSRQEIMAERNAAVAPAKTAPAPAAADPELTAEPKKSPTPPPTGDKSPLPRSLNLEVAFVIQAPFGVWDYLHDDACEEAAVIMLKAYQDGQKSMSKEEMERKIQAAVAYEMKTFGYFENTTVEETVRMLKDFYGLTTAKAMPLDSIDDLRRQIAAGRPVILPAWGRALKNPYFRGGGPAYHMLVAKGYTPGKIITNDPGTKRGADYVYDEQLLFDAVHDWNGGDVKNGEKLMIVVE